MKRLILTFTASLIIITAFANDITISYQDLKINNLYTITKKENIIKTFGNPSKVFEPKYECGFLSEAEQGQKYYSLQYTFLKFTGNSKEGYQLEEIKFNPKANFKFTYKGRKLSHTTNKNQFEALFKIKIKGSEISLRYKNSESALVFTFINGLLSKINDWSPC